MMSAFLDALGIAHENGLIAAEETPRPDDAKLAEAAAAIRQSFPGEDVQLYFSTLALQDPEVWGGLEKLAGPSDNS
jgi:hypothetical protein